jgi:hypothetical protein
MRIKKSLRALLALFLSLAFFSCSNDPVSTGDSTIIATDYSKPEHWLSLPANVSKEVDVFYLYPTAWQKAAGDSNICNIDNPSMLVLSDLALKRQATAFNTVANIYAPYYRQLDIFYYISLSPQERIQAVAGIPTKDAIAAFDYYIRNYNNGRPFILAGHSQGSIVLTNLLATYMKENPQVYSRMIAAYVIGYSVTNDFLVQNPHLKFANGPDDTGVIISYNTEASTVSAPGNPVVLPGALSINPITWTRSGESASADRNLGSIVLNPNGTVAAGIPTPVMNFADAKVDVARGVVVCTTVDVNIWSPGNAVFGKGVFHSFDYPFYYYNIRQNATNRTNKYFNR